MDGTIKVGQTVARALTPLLPSVLEQIPSRHRDVKFLRSRVEDGMARFFFDIDDGKRSFKDDEGSDLADADAARKELVGALAQMAKDQLPDGDERDFSGSFANEAGKVVFNARLSLRSGWIEATRKTLP